MIVDGMRVVKKISDAPIWRWTTMGLRYLTFEEMRCASLDRGMGFEDALRCASIASIQRGSYVPTTPSEVVLDGDGVPKGVRWMQGNDAVDDDFRIINTTGMDAKDTRSTWGWNALFFAADADEVDDLIEMGVDPNAFDKDRHFTPLKEQVWRPDVVERLLCHGARPNLKGKGGPKGTAVHAAATGMFALSLADIPPPIKEKMGLIEGGIDRKEAMRRVQMSMIHLIRAGGDLTIKDRDGRTPRAFWMGGHGKNDNECGRMRDEIWKSVTKDGKVDLRHL